MVKFRNLVWAAFFLASLVQGTAYSGEVINMQCANKDCKHALEFQLGGGMFFEQATGYCAHCKKIVALTWTSPHALQAGVPVPKPVVEPPKPLAEVWDPASGQVRKIYRCPNGDGAFMEIRGVDDFKCCPKCSRPTMKQDTSRPRLMVD